MADTSSSSATPEAVDYATSPGTPASEDSSAASTPLDEQLATSPDEPPRRVPSLRSVSDPRNMNPNSTARGILGMARGPRSSPSQSSLTGGPGILDNSVMAKARALHQQRMGKGLSQPVVSPGSVSSPASPAGSMNGVMNGFPGNLRLPSPMQPASPGGTPRTAVTPLTRPSLSERRANKGGMGMSLSNMSPGTPPSGMRRPGAPKLSDITGDPGDSENGNGPPKSKMDDFKKYIDVEKGWITFDGAATITSTGVNFSNGQTFSISLNEIDKLDELGKGNYGTVYKVRHARPRVPRFGHGLSGPDSRTLANAKSELSPLRASASGRDPTRDDGTTGIVMAMKEIRLELDDAKFTTILKELVILHECISPYIIDFYGAFFQDGAVYICIEHMDGGSIDKLYGGGIPESVLRKITYSTVMGLKSLKDEHNIIHRDVKPTNILANTRGQIKICDFGVSGNLVASIARTNIGCQSYMAPERISGGGMAIAGNADGTYSVQSDIWSLGLTIIECATGRYPYPPEVSSTIFSQLNAIVEGEPPDLPEQGYSDIARDFVHGCLNKIPTLRPPYAALLKQAWLAPLAKPETIAEEAEEGEDADKVAEAVGKMNLSSDTSDAEVAAWVKSVLEQKASGEQHSGERAPPALHAVSLDGVSPVASPN